MEWKGEGCTWEGRWAGDLIHQPPEGLTLGANKSLSNFVMISGMS